jgi:hypothetical protein
MALLFADGFDLYTSINDVIRGGWMVESTTLQSYSSSLGKYGGGCLLNKSNNAFRFSFGPVNGGGTYTVSFWYYPHLTGGGTADTLLRLTCNGSGGSQLARVEHNASGDVKVFNQPNTQVGSTASAALTNDTWHWIEFQVTTGTTDTNGAIILKINGVTHVNVSSADTFNSGQPWPSGIALLGSTSSAAFSRFDDIIINDGTGASMNTFIGEAKIETLIVDGDGTAQDFTALSGTAFSNVDDALSSTDDDSTYISSSTAGHKSEFTLTNLSNRPASIMGIQMRSRARKTDAGTRVYRTYLKAGASTVNGDSKGVATTYYWHRNGVTYLNPTTGLPWTQSQVNSLQIGVEML